MKGHMHVAPHADFAYIETGEVKVAREYKDAVPQLGLRLNVLAWLVHICYNVPRDRIVLVGRLYVPRSKGVAVGVDAQQQQEALMNWGYVLYLDEV